jgi:hypothetical protein
MIKRDIDPNDRKLHAAATEILRKRGSVSLPNTWAGQTAALKSEKGAEALKLATAALKKEAAVTKPAKK